MASKNKHGMNGAETMSVGKTTLSIFPFVRVLENILNNVRTTVLLFQR